jgi:16S rRNA (uracil1498-N3)-methyltransferase
MPGHFHFIADKVDETTAFFGAVESKHMAGVLRYTVGQDISFTNGQGLMATGSISSIRKNEVEATVHSQILNKRSKNLNLFVGVLRQADRMEWLVEKCTEMGVASITFLQTKNTQKGKVNMDRMQKKVWAAVKQSHGCFMPIIQIQSLADALKIEGEKYIAYCWDHQNKVNPSDMPAVANVFIGPEGDFTQAEADMAMAAGAQPLYLGHNILRTETACLVACGVHYL